MGKVKSWLRSMPLQRAFVSLVLVMAVFVVCASSATIYFCATIQERILATVTYIEKEELDQDEESYDIVITDIGKLTPKENGAVIMLSKEYRLQNLTDQQRFLYYGAKVSMVLIPALMFVAGTIFCAWLFYSVKIKKPLALLLQSADRISQSELDFELNYPASDEMGVLCRAMDTMRSALLKSQQETWTLMEERRKLSASIAHDLRTPITVMKGYTEYLSHNVPLGRISENKLLETIGNISQATGRLERYVNQVRDVQALDAMPVQREICSLQDFFLEQEDEYTVLAEQHKLRFLMDIGEIPDIQVMLDATLTYRLIDNVIANALRFARNEILMEVGWKENVLSICVCDDGSGFSDDALKSATEPFYKENSENDHFGLGLSICNTLCLKQDGNLTLSNLNGARVQMQIKAEKIEPIDC